MQGDVNVAAVAALLADPTRTAILMALLDGRAWPAGDLARAAHVTPSTASNHLSKLVEHQLLQVEQQGRHRYFSLTNPAIAQALEQLATIAPASPIRSLRASELAKAVRSARMCYNHLAGKLGVTLTETLVRKELLTSVDGGYLISEAGERWLQKMGIECSALRQHRPMFAPSHIDWSERFHHVAGALGAALANRFFELEWVKRVPNSRAVHLTETGEQALFTELGLCLSEDNTSLSA